MYRTMDLIHTARHMVVASALLCAACSGALDPADPSETSDPAVPAPAASAAAVTPVAAHAALAVSSRGLAPEGYLDGNLVVYTSSGQAIWASNTCCR